MKLYELLTEKKSSFEILKANKLALTPEEREQCMKKKAVWHFSHMGKPTPAVWKGKDSSGKLWYVTNTHRCYQKAPSLQGAIRKYHDVVKGTA